MPKALKVTAQQRSEVVDYARRIGLDPNQITSDGFTVEPFVPDQDGTPRWRVTYRGVLLTTEAPPGH